MNDFSRILGALSIIAIIACSACAQEDDQSNPDIWSETMTDSMHALSAVACHPREADTCDRGEACLAIGEDRQGDPILHLCASGRCNTQDDCGAGYVCRVDHCIAVERDQPERDEDTRERDTDTRERDTDTRERDTDTRERDTDTRERDTDTRERDTDERERDNDIRERDDDTREQTRRGGIDLKIASRVLVEPTRRRGAYNVTVAVESQNHSTFENLWFEISLRNGRSTLAAARRPAPVGRDAVVSRVRFENVPLPEGSFISIDPLNLVDETHEDNNAVRVAP